jgi:hypothetical protein
MKAERRMEVQDYIMLIIFDVLLVVITAVLLLIMKKFG